MLELLRSPWHWSVAGVLIGLTVPLLYLIGNKPFGISSSFRHLCAACLPVKNIGYFQYNWKKEIWNLFFVAGVLIGGIVGATLLRNPAPFEVAEGTKEVLALLSVSDFSQMAPGDIFSLNGLTTARGFLMIIIGGFLVGFGTRYAGGCTSGHAITGISNMQASSLIATICFMAGGFIMTWLLLPYILKL